MMNENEDAADAIRDKRYIAAMAVDSSPSNKSRVLLDQKGNEKQKEVEKGRVG